MKLPACARQAVLAPCSFSQAGRSISWPADRSRGAAPAASTSSDGAHILAHVVPFLPAAQEARDQHKNEEHEEHEEHEKQQHGKQHGSSNEGHEKQQHGK